MIVLAARALAGDKPSPQEMLDTARKTSDISALGPYVLTGTLVVNPGTKNELTGSLAVYRDRDRARVDVHISGRSETRITIGNKDYVDPDQILFSGTWLNEFDRIWDPELPRQILNSRDKWGNVYKQQILGAAAWCMEKGRDPVKRRVCVDAHRGTVLSSTPAEFSDFISVGEAWFPQKIRIADRFGAPVEVLDIKVSAYAVESTLFEIPAHAMELENCTDREPEKVIDTPMPARSDLSQHATNGTVVLFAFVNKEGQVAALKMLTRVQSDFNTRILNAIKKWRFKPVTCGARPVNSAFTIEADGHFF
ncbi:MAG: hypothetical protein WA672_09375 [Candidatus Angelobacter sp.]